MVMKSLHATISGARFKTFDQARGRLVIMAFFFAAAFFLIAVRLVDLTLLDAAHRQTAQNSPGQATPNAGRGDITDRNGVLLATTLSTASLYADPALIDDAEKAAHDLVTVLPELSYSDTLQKLQSGRRFIWLQRNLTPRQHYAVNALGYPGFQFKHETRRLYPHGDLTAHLTGYTDVDGHGIAGLEKAFDNALTAGEGPLALTVDIRLQHILHRELKKSIEDFNAKGGAGLIVDAQTGDIMAMVSLPDFDPHFPGAATPDQKFNRATLGVYEMGSTFKLFSIAAALESGSVKPGDSFDARAPLKVGRFLIRDFHPQNRFLTVPEVFIHSSNIGTALIAEKTGTANMKLFFKQLNLLEPVSAGLPETGSPLVPNPWRDVSTLTASYGHGIAVTPLQSIMAAAAIINGGTYHQPSLVLKNEVATEADALEKRVVSPQTSNKMRQLMRLVVTEGTGSQADVPGYRVGGKTGTAEKTAVGGYNKSALLSSFVGAFPIENPRYIVMAMIDEPKGNKKSFGYATGGWTAAPVVGRVIAQMGPLYNIMPTSDAAPEITNAMNMYVHKEKELAAY